MTYIQYSSYTPFYNVLYICNKYIHKYTVYHCTVHGMQMNIFYLFLSCHLFDILVSYFEESTTGRDFCVPHMLCLCRVQSHNCVPVGGGNLDCSFVFFQVQTLLLSALTRALPVPPRVSVWTPPCRPLSQCPSIFQTNRYCSLEPEYS